MRAVLLCLTISLLFAEAARADLTPEQQKRIEELQKLIAQKKAEVSKLEAELAKLDPSRADKFKGRWRTAETERAGAKLKRDMWVHLNWEFKGGGATVAVPVVGDVEYRVLFDAAKSPATIDFAHKDPKLTLTGIFKFEGDKLVLCFREGDAGRPLKFDSNEGDGCWLLTLERVK